MLRCNWPSNVRSTLYTVLIVLGLVAFRMLRPNRAWLLLPKCSQLWPVFVYSQKQVVPALVIKGHHRRNSRALARRDELCQT